MPVDHPASEPVLVAIEAAAPGDARAVLAAAALVDMNPPVPWTVSGVTITIISGPFLSSGMGNRSAEVWIFAEDVNGPLPVENPYRFVGLPRVVDNGTPANPLLNIEAIHDYETLDVAFKRQIAEVVLAVAEQMGWTP